LNLEHGNEDNRQVKSTISDRSDEERPTPPSLSHVTVAQLDGQTVEQANNNNNNVHLLRTTLLRSTMTISQCRWMNTECVMFITSTCQSASNHKTDVVCSHGNVTAAHLFDVFLSFVFFSSMR
jgi:hypothetical protein